MGRTSRPCRNLAALSLLLAIALAGCGGWTKKDTLAELGFATMTSVDWVQTDSIVTVCEEQNSIIGACGENLSPDVYFPMAIALHAAISAALPPHWRLAWQAVATGAELNQVWSNAANGFGLDGSIPPLPVTYTSRRSPGHMHRFSPFGVPSLAPSP